MLSGPGPELVFLPQIPLHPGVCFIVFQDSWVKLSVDGILRVGPWGRMQLTAILQLRRLLERFLLLADPGASIGSTSQG